MSAHTAAAVLVNSEQLLVFVLLILLLQGKNSISTAKYGGPEGSKQTQLRKTQAKKSEVRKLQNAEALKECLTRCSFWV